ncbi:LPXTG cell wall anchor domain-containing protein [Listeria monocytogenes]|nr:LPXTG cell wall anchor domain-containing protein [Listeria monocytogenes]
MVLSSFHFKKTLKPIHSQDPYFTLTIKPTGNNTGTQTGEQSTTNIVIAGLSLTMLFILVWFKRKKV